MGLFLISWKSRGAVTQQRWQLRPPRAPNEHLIQSKARGRRRRGLRGGAERDYQFAHHWHRSRRKSFCCRFDARKCPIRGVLPFEWIVWGLRTSFRGFWMFFEFWRLNEPFKTWVSEVRCCLLINFTIVTSRFFID